MDLKKLAAQKAVELIQPNSVIGLGAGSTMAHMVGFLQRAVQNGLALGVATPSFNTRQLLLQSGITLLNTADLTKIDIYFDGCDQFDQNLTALKSGGGIHTQEKLLACMARQFVLVGDETKYSETLQTKYPLVIEVLPQACNYVAQAVPAALPVAKMLLRMGDKRDGPVVTENGNYLFDLWFDEWPPLATINPALKAITGIVETSLFYNIASKAIIAAEGGVLVLEKGSQA